MARQRRRRHRVMQQACRQLLPAAVRPCGARPPQTMSVIGPPYGRSAARPGVGPSVEHRSPASRRGGDDGHVKMPWQQFVSSNATYSNWHKGWPSRRRPSPDRRRHFLIRLYSPPTSSWNGCFLTGRFSDQVTALLLPIKSTVQFESQCHDEVMMLLPGFLFTPKRRFHVGKNVRTYKCVWRDSS